MSNGHMNGKSFADMAALAAQAQPLQQQIDILRVAADYLGLSGLALREMAPRIERCLCGQCAGAAKLVFDGALHLRTVPGGGLGPEMIKRSDAPKMVEKEVSIEGTKVQ
jgi:hypothetical protein